MRFLIVSLNVCFLVSSLDCIGSNGIKKSHGVFQAIKSLTSQWHSYLYQCALIRGGYFIDKIKYFVTTSNIQNFKCWTITKRLSTFLLESTFLHSAISHAWAIWILLCLTRFRQFIFSQDGKMYTVSFLL